MELPLRLLVSAVVSGLTIPAILGGLNTYEVHRASAQAEGAIDAIVRTAQAFYFAGGGSQIVRVDLTGGITANVEHVEVGDGPGGPRAPSATYKVTGLPAVFLLSDPPVPMAGEGGPLRLGPGVHAVRVSFEGDGPVHLAVA